MKLKSWVLAFFTLITAFLGSKMQIKKIILFCDILVTSQTVLWHSPGVVINRSQFDACTFKSLGGLKETDRQTYRQTELHFIAYAGFKEGAMFSPHT